MLTKLEIRNLEHYEQVNDETFEKIFQSIRALTAKKQVDLPEDFMIGIERIPQNTELPIEGFHVYVFEKIAEEPQTKTYQIDINIDGSLNMVTKFTHVDTNVIEANVSVQNFRWSLKVVKSDIMLKVYCV